MAFGLDLGNLLVHLRADDSQYNKVMRGAISVMHSGVAQLEKYAKRAALAVGASMIASAKVFASFEEQMKFVSTMLDENTMKYMPGFSRAVREMAVQFGEGTDTISRGLYNVLSASIPANKALEVLAFSLKAAKAGMTDTATTTYAITGILNAYSLSADKAEYVSDLLFASVKRGQTTFAELAPSIGRVTSIAASAGVALEEVTAALSTITRAGISTDQAITFLRSSLIALQGKGEDNIQMAADLGLTLSTQSLRTNQLSGMIEQLSKLEDEQINKIFTDIRSRQALIALLANQKGFIYDLNVMMKSAGMTQEAYNKMTGSLTLSMKQFWQVLKYVGVEIGSRLNPGIQQLSRWFVRNKEVVADWAIAFTDRIIFVKDVLFDWLRLMRTNFSQEFQNVLKVMIEVLKVTGKVFIDLAMRIGKGMGKALKAGILGDELNSNELFSRVNKLYKESGGKRVKAPGSDARFYTGPMLAVEDTELWDKLTAEVIAKHEGRFAESVFSGFSDAVVNYFAEFSVAAVEGTGEVGNLVDKHLGILKMKDINRQWLFYWNNMKTGVQPFVDAAKGVKEHFKTLLGFGNSIVKTTEEIAEEVDKASGVLTKMNMSVQSMLNALDFELAMLGKTSEERERAVSLSKFQMAVQEMISEEVLKTVEGQIRYNELMDTYIAKLDLIAERVRIINEETNKALEGWDAVGNSIEVWANSAMNWGKNLGDVLVDSFDRAADSFASMLMQEEVDWKAFGRMFIKELIAMIIKLQAAVVLKAILGNSPYFGTSGANSNAGVDVPQSIMTGDRYAGNGYADGGIAWTPQLATVGEKEPELITPFSKLKSLMGKTPQPNINIKAIFVRDETEAQLEVMRSPAGEKIIVQKVARNRRSLG